MNFWLVIIRNCGNLWRFIVSRSVDFADNAEFVACKIDLPEYGTAYISAVDFAMAVC